MAGIFEKNGLVLEGVGIDGLRAYPPMFHRHMELICVLEGEVDLEIGGVKARMQKGDLSVTFPYVIHNNDRADAEVALVMFDPHICGAFEGKLSNSLPETPVVRSRELPPIIPQMLKKIIEKKREGTECAAETARGYLLASVGELLGALPLHRLDGASMESTQRVLMYCAESFRDPELSLLSVSQTLHISRDYISRLFSSKLGCSFRGYINQMRLNEAKSLLAEGGRQILDVCYECGFDNQSTFNRLFLHAFGMTPTAWRKANGE